MEAVPRGGRQVRLVWFVRYPPAVIMQVWLAAVPTPTPSPVPSGSAVSVAQTVTATTVPDGTVVQVVQPAGSSGVQWVTLAVAVVAAGAAIWAAVLQRKTGKESVKQAGASAIAAGESAKTAKEAADEIDEWRKREESMRMLRWAIDHAISPTPTVSAAGLEALEVLRSHRELVQPVDVLFIDQVIEAIVEVIASQIDDDDEVVVDNGL